MKEKLTADGKTKEEAIMLLNHKDALDFILDVPHYLKDLSVHRIEEICALKWNDINVIDGTITVSRTTLNLYVHPNMEQKKRCISKMFKSLGK